MRCEECLPLIEEYVDGELDGRVVERLAAHLSTCAGCAGELGELRREQEIYALYRRDVEVTPAHWNIVRARIEQEKEAGTQTPRSRAREWFKGALGARKHFRPAFVAALALLVIGITAGVIYMNSRARPSELAVEPAEQRNETGSPARVNEALPPRDSNKDDVAVADDKNRQKSNPSRPTLTVANSTTATAGQKKNAVAARLPRSESPRLEQPRLDESAQFAAVVADRKNMISGVRMSAPEATGDFDLELARHAERAELLLRSFRNVRPPASRSVLDVSYEKEQSRKLLYQNIALRQDASARGDRPAAELLNTLEPILLDIANLPDRVKPRDVRSIERRMEKKEIVATLQVRTLLASN